MGSFEEHVQKSCDAREIPGVILIASDDKGKFLYQKAFGPKNPAEPMDLNATFIMASCTKLITTIAAMQCVERGLIKLDDDVTGVLPELIKPRILHGFDEKTGKPQYSQAKNVMTLRHLLTHSAGFTYDMMDPKMHQWRRERKEKLNDINSGLLHQISLPLLYEPGTSWSYGVALDWVGLLVGRLYHTNLEDYCEKNIWTPLGIKNMTFHQELKPEVRKNLVKLTIRKPDEGGEWGLPVRDAGKVEWTDTLLYANPTPMGDELGGAGVIGNPGEYLKILLSILKDDGKLLKSSTIDEMFRPQLQPESLAVWNEFANGDLLKDAFASQKVGTKQDWGLGGALVCEDTHTGRKKGTMNWSGLPNLLWTIDRSAGLVTLYSSNVVPFGDFKSHDMQVLFEKEMYKRLAEQQGVKASI